MHPPTPKGLPVTKSWLSKNVYKKGIQHATDPKSLAPSKFDMLSVVSKSLHRYFLEVVLDRNIVSKTIGEIVKGQVILSLPKPLELDRINIALVGKERL